MAIRSPAVALALVACFAAQAWGQSAPHAAPASASDRRSFSASLYTYVLPDERNYVQPTVTAEHAGGFHLEARYNYEDRETFSAWAGYTFGGGDTVEWQVKPLLGGVFGNTSGIAPGYKGSVSWRILEGYSEGEYVFDIGEPTDSFFYNWSELAVAPAEWFRAGLVTQRTHAYKTDRDVQRGLLVGTTIRKLDVTAYVFNPVGSKPTVIVAATWSW